jgi:hypothetical protein
LAALHLEHSENHRRFLTLKDMQGHVVDPNSGNGLAIRGAMMSVAVKDQVGAMTIDHFRKT